MRKHLIISGKVQGVGFRNWLYMKAIDKNISGWVKNTMAGEVEAVLIGEDEDVNDIIKKCQIGPSLSNITKVKIQDYQQDYFNKTFDILK